MSRNFFVIGQEIFWFCFFVFVMRILYKREAILSINILGFGRKISQPNSGGPRGVFVSSFILCNCLKFSHICDPVARPSPIKIILRISANNTWHGVALRVKWRGHQFLNHRRTTTGADYALLKKFCATPQKRLDICSFCTHNGAEQTLTIVIVLLLARPRRPDAVKPHWSGFFRGVFHVKHHSSRSHSRVMSASMPARLSL